MLSRGRFGLCDLDLALSNKLTGHVHRALPIAQLCDDTPVRAGTLCFPAPNPGFGTKVNPFHLCHLLFELWTSLVGQV